MPKRDLARSRSLLPTGVPNATTVRADDRLEILARGPWAPECVTVRWADDTYKPSPFIAARATRELRALAERGSQSHDSLTGRLAGFRATPETLELDLQPIQWSLRLVPGG